jgi:hypothetical protein
VSVFIGYKRENKIVDRMVAGTQFKSALKFFLHAILIYLCPVQILEVCHIFRRFIGYCMLSFGLRYFDETRTHKFLAFTSKATSLLVKNKSFLFLFTVYMCLHRKWTSSALTRICLPLNLDFSSSLGHSWWYILTQCFPTQIWVAKRFYMCTCY